MMEVITMSSAMNHKKRSHRSESKKAGSFRASARAQLIRQSQYDLKHQSLLGRVAAMFHRRSPKPKETAVK